MIICTILAVETCHGCKGTGRLGTAGIYVIFCEMCGGQGARFRERCCLTEEDDD